MFDKAIQLVFAARPQGYTILGARINPTTPAELQLHGRDPDGDDWRGAIALPLGGCDQAVAEELLAEGVAGLWRHAAAARAYKGCRVWVDGRRLPGFGQPTPGQRLGGIVDRVDTPGKRFELVLWPPPVPPENPPAGT